MPPSFLDIVATFLIIQEASNQSDNIANIFLTHDSTPKIHAHSLLTFVYPCQTSPW